MVNCRATALIKGGKEWIPDARLDKAPLSHTLSSGRNKYQHSATLLFFAVVFCFFFVMRQFNYHIADDFFRLPVKNKMGKELWREQSEPRCRALLEHLVVSLEPTPRVAGQQLFHPQWWGFTIYCGPGHTAECQFDCVFFIYLFLEWLQHWRIVLNDSSVKPAALGEKRFYFSFNVSEC